MDITKSVVSGVTVLELGGQAQAAPIIQALDGELRGAISLDGLKVLLDVRRIEFVDSATLEAFVSFQKKFNQVNAYMAFANMTPYMKKIFEITRIAELFACFDDLDGATKAARARRR
ncbi:MAG: STAS domain-containing protein [Acidobacteriota bacterium]